MQPLPPTFTSEWRTVSRIQEGVSRHFEYDAGDVLRAFYVDAGTGTEPSTFTHYLYDAGGTRIKKITRKQTGNPQVSLYIDGAIDTHYEINTSGNPIEVEQEYHIMDGRARIARRTLYDSSFSGTQTPEYKYNLENHPSAWLRTGLGSSSVTLEANGSIYSLEDFAARAQAAKKTIKNGETSFGSFHKKRYRYCGKERDEESGLYYYGARYYAAWTCRFVNLDPLASKYPFYTPFQYAGNDPINHIDIDGLEKGGPGQMGPQFTVDDGGRSVAMVDYAMKTGTWDDEGSLGIGAGIGAGLIGVALGAMAIETFAVLGTEGVAGIAVEQMTEKLVQDVTGCDNICIPFSPMSAKNSIDDIVNYSKKLFNKVDDAVPSPGGIGNGVISPNSAPKKAANNLDSPGSQSTKVNDAATSSSKPPTTANTKPKTPEFQKLGKSGEELYQHARKTEGHKLGQNLGRVVGDKAQAHHLIPLQLIRDNQIIKFLYENGWDIHQAGNGILLKVPFHTRHDAYTNFISKALNESIDLNGINPKDFNALKSFVEESFLPTVKSNVDELYNIWKNDPNSPTLNNAYKLLLQQ